MEKKFRLLGYNGANTIFHTEFQQIYTISKLLEKFSNNTIITSPINHDITYRKYYCNWSYIFEKNLNAYLKHDGLALLIKKIIHKDNSADDLAISTWNWYVDPNTNIVSDEYIELLYDYWEVE